MTTAYTTTHEGTDTPSITKTLPFPADWGNYSLTKMFDVLERQAVATFANARAQVQPVLELDAALFEQAPVIFHQPQKHELIPSMLFVRMFSGQRTAARLVFSGQQYEARAVLRSSLECGVYAWALMADNALRDIWTNRDADDAARKTARGAFSWNKLTAALGAKSPDLAARVTEIYDNLIDLGAHPNPGGIIENVFLTEDDAGKLQLMTSFGGGDPDTFAAGIAELLGVCRACFELLQLAMPQRMDSAGVGTSVSKLFSSLPSTVSA